MDPKKAEDLEINAELYRALMGHKDAEVVKICKRIPKGPLHTLTIHEDTVIHMATYHKRTKLVLELLDMVSPSDYHKLSWQNGGGNTILHETATNNRTVKAAKVMLEKAPMLLSMTNKEGETALFYAARHGKTQIFQFLHDEVSKSIEEQDLKIFLERDDKFTLLHIAILSGNYWIAHYIATHHKDLIAETDADDMTPLQLFATRKPEFYPRSGLKRIIFKLMGGDLEDLEKKRWKLFRRLAKEKHKCEYTQKFAKLLIVEDNSWEKTESWTDKRGLKIHDYGKTASEQQKMELSEHKEADTPLLLATIHDSTEIVREILRMYPQAVEHVDADGRNILHLAVLHRRFEIIKVVEEMEYPLDRLRGRVDKNFNTLLHMVGRNADEITEDVKHHAQRLKEDQRLFKKIKKISTTIDYSTRNTDMKTPKEVFIDANDNLREQAKVYMCENAKNCSIVAVLIATVAFTSAYTIPGGVDKKGYPVLKNRPLFILFTFADAVSLSSALTSVIIFLNIVTSPFKFKDFESSLFEKQLIGIILLIISVAMMMTAFAVTLILAISNENATWKNMVVYSVSVFPVFVFVFPYLLQFKQCLKSTYSVVKVATGKAAKFYHEFWDYKPPPPQPVASYVQLTARSPI